MPHVVDTTCTECTTPVRIPVDEHIALIRDTPRLCSSCKQKREVLYSKKPELKDALPPLLGLGNYRAYVELQWKITAEDLEYVCQGDVEEDFARRSWFKIRELLSQIAGSGKNSPIAHWHMLGIPTHDPKKPVHHGSPLRCLGSPLLSENRPTSPAERLHKALNEVLSIVHDQVDQSLQYVLTDAMEALSFGKRQGWPVNPLFDDQVPDHEKYPLSEKEAARRLNDLNQIVE